MAKMPQPPRPMSPAPKPAFKGFSLYGINISPIMLAVIGGVGYWWWMKKQGKAR